MRCWWNKPGFDVGLGFLEDTDLGITGWRLEIPAGFCSELPVGAQLVSSVFYMKN